MADQRAEHRCTRFGDGHHFYTFERWAWDDTFCARVPVEVVGRFCLCGEPEAAVSGSGRSTLSHPLGSVPTTGCVTSEYHACNLFLSDVMPPVSTET